MSTEIERVIETIGPKVSPTEEVPMVRQERWEGAPAALAAGARADRRAGPTV
jgi:hypothetical protein